MAKFFIIFVVLFLPISSSASMFESKYLKALYGTWQEHQEEKYMPVPGKDGKMVMEKIEQKKGTIIFTDSTINENNNPPAPVKYNDHGDGLITISHKSKPIIYVRILSENKLNYALVSHPQAVVQFEKISSISANTNTAATQTTSQYKSEIGTVFFHDFGNKKQIEIYTNAPDGSWVCEFHGTSNSVGEQLEFITEEDPSEIVTVIHIDDKIQVQNNCNCCGFGGTITGVYILEK